MTTDAPPLSRHTPTTTPLPAALSPVASALEPLYRWAVRRRNRGFDRGERVWRAPAPVVSVGNLSVGGTGKTPMVMFLARELLAQGRRPVIAMRGYAKRAGERSDEEAEYLAALEGVRVMADPDRSAAIAAHFDSGAKADCVLLDDGFQHRFVARDVDIVLLDATRDPFEDRCLPAGWLREPVESLRRAHAIVLTRTDRATPARVRAMIDRVRSVVADGCVVATTSHRWVRVERRRPGEPPERMEPGDALRAARVHLVAGIGNPGAFAAQAKAMGALIASESRVPDHARHTHESVRAIVSDAQSHGARAVLTTTKDWVKIAPLLRDEQTQGIDWLVPVVEMEFHEGRQELLARVRGVLRDPAEEVPSP